MLWVTIAVSIVTGVSVIGLWMVLLARHAVPELAAGLPSIRFHIAAELLAAAGLLVGAALLALADGPVARLVSAVSLGAIAYSAVNSPGYYADRGDRAVVAMFGIVLLVIVAALLALAVA